MEVGNPRETHESGQASIQRLFVPCHAGDQEALDTFYAP